jgi:hypothetical protein
VELQKLLKLKVLKKEEVPTVAAEEPKSAPAEKSEPIAQETSTDGQRILASPLAKENCK